jgi:hypothetical protein
MSAARKKKRFVSKPGDAFGIPLSDGRCGFAALVFRDSFGRLFDVSRVTRSEIPESLTSTEPPWEHFFYAYVNGASIQHWHNLGRIMHQTSNTLPPRYSGHPNYGWTIESPTGQQQLSAKEVPESELIKRGYIPKTLWLAPDIEEAILTKTPPQWKWPG